MINNTNIRRITIKSLNHLFLKVLPKNKIGDYLYALFLFFVHHKKLPKKNKFLFNDYLFMIKTSNEIFNPLRIFITDKEYLKLFISSVLGSKYNVPTLKILKDKNEIYNYKFPKNCCIKPTHSSGQVILKKQRDEPDLGKINSWLNINHYNTSRENNYKFLKPKIIVEPLIFNSVDVQDYKFFCFKGKVRLIQTDLDRHTNHTRKLFDVHWNDLKASMGYPYNKTKINPPTNLSKMIDIAEKISIYFNFIRVDLYSNGNQILVGELTNCHGGACEKFFPKKSEISISKLLFAGNGF